MNENEKIKLQSKVAYADTEAQTGMLEALIKAQMARAEAEMLEELMKAEKTRLIKTKIDNF